MEYLSQRGVDFTAKDVRADPQALQELIEGGFQSTPIIKVGDTAIVGFDRAALDKALA